MEKGKGGREREEGGGMSYVVYVCTCVSVCS